MSSLKTCLFSHMSIGVTLTDWYPRPYRWRSIHGIVHVAFEHIPASLGTPVAAGYSPACAETCSDPIIGMDRFSRNAPTGNTELKEKSMSVPDDPLESMFAGVVADPDRDQL